MLANLLVREASCRDRHSPNPLRSVTNDADNVRRAAESVGGPVVLVGHSYGGAVITEAPSKPGIVGLVYVAAFAPDHGGTALELDRPVRRQHPGETVRAYPLGDGTNDHLVDRELFPNQFRRRTSPRRGGRPGR